MLLHKMQKEIATPSLLAEKDQFLIKFADTEEEIEEALKLRYRVFNLEQGKGLDSANDSGIDRDEFDDFCLHLIVVEKSSKKPVGTYRIHMGPVANSAIGFYSEREFNVRGLDKIASQTIEVGRSCVAPEYRNGAVVALLWSGISELLMRSKLTYLLGCVSLETNDPAAAWALYRNFQSTGKNSDILSATPTETFKIPPASEDDIQKYIADKKLNRLIPPLFKGYLRLGSMICGEPAYDHEFGTIDFLILLNTTTLPERYMRHFLSDSEKESGA